MTDQAALNRIQGEHFDKVLAEVEAEEIARRDAYEDAEQAKFITNQNGSSQEEREARRLETPPSAVELAKQRTEGFVKAICGSAKTALVERRDEIDTLLTQLDSAERNLATQIGDFAMHAANIMSRCVAIRAEVEEISAPFKLSTITQRKE